MRWSRGGRHQARSQQRGWPRLGATRPAPHRVQRMVSPGQPPRGAPGWAPAPTPRSLGTGRSDELPALPPRSGAALGLPTRPLESSCSPGGGQPGAQGSGAEGTRGRRCPPLRRAVWRDCLRSLRGLASHRPRGPWSRTRGPPDREGCLPLPTPPVDRGCSISAGSHRHPGPQPALLGDTEGGLPSLRRPLTCPGQDGHEPQCPPHSPPPAATGGCRARVGWTSL